MMAFGAVLSMLAFGRYRSVNSAIDAGRVEPDRWLVVLVTVCIVVISLAMMASVALSAGEI